MGRETRVEGPAQINSSDRCLAKSAAFEVGIGQPHALHLGRNQVSPAQICAFKVRILQESRVQIGTFEICATEVCTS